MRVAVHPCAVRVSRGLPRLPRSRGLAYRMPRAHNPGKPARWISHTVSAEEAGKTVEQLLVDSMRISRRMIQRLTRAHGVQLNRRPAYLARPVRAGDVVTARVEWAEESGLRPVPMEL